MNFSNLNRRAFFAAGTLSLLSLRQILLAAATSFETAPARSLSFNNIHTGEKLDVVYWEKGEYVPASLSDINHLLRDYRTGDVLNIELRLLDTLCALRRQLGTQEPFELISGYRSPATNAMLRSEGHGVAGNSLHMKGIAADVRIPGRSLQVLSQAALALQAGGVGYYPAQFVHIDVGRIRTW